MAKQTWKPGNMLYPLPAVMVSVTDGEGNDNIITVAWAGTVCTNPPMVSISVRPTRFSYDMICKTKEFVLNLTTEELAYATDYCGVRSGREVDKFQELHLTKEKADHVKAPMIGEAPVNIECKVKKIEKLGSHHMFLAEVVAVHADEAYMDKNNKFHQEIQEAKIKFIKKIQGKDNECSRKIKMELKMLQYCYPIFRLTSLIWGYKKGI